MKLKTIVIDDEPLAAMLIEGYISKTPFLEHIATFSTAVEAMNSEELAVADLLFLDIQMPTLTGLEFSRMVDPRTRIIFTTAFNQYAIDGYKVSALDYLLKPISY
ncbi:MAG: response regulator, partial [Rikenellaceae bacterium]